MYRCVIRTLIVGGMLIAPARNARAEKTFCGAGEVDHTVAAGDTMLRIAEHYYAKDGDPTAEKIARWLEDHNRARIGENGILQPGMLLCLPEYFEGATWEATRRWPVRPRSEGDKPPVTTDKVEDKPHVDKPAPTSAESRRIETSEPPKEAPASTVQLLITAPIGQDKPVVSSKKKTKVLRRVSAEVLGGALVPFSATTRSDFYRALGFAGVGARVTLGSIEIAPRLLFVGSNFNTTYNGLPDQGQALLGGGGAAQIGVAFARGAWRFTPGIEGGWVGVRRSVTRTDYPHEGTVATSEIGLSVAGVFFRPEYQFRSNSRINVAVEVGGDVVAFYRTNGDLDAGLNGRISGGVGYAF